MYTTNSGANMDAESDESERWEDFYGSSTDLTPALLSFYDTLNTSLESKYNNNNNKSNGNNSKIQQRPQQEDEEIYQGTEPKCTFSTFGNNYNLKRNSPGRNGQSETTAGSNKHRNNIRLLSPNVQRLITHSDAEHVDTIDIEALQQQQNSDKESNSSSALSSPHFTKKTLSHTISGHSQRGKLSHIPLSKVTGQLTAAGNELVTTFDSSGEFINTLSSTKMPHEVPLTDTDDDDDDVDDANDDDDEKTPTNGAKPFNYDFRPLKHQSSIQFIELEKLATTTQLLNSRSVSQNSSKVPENTEYLKIDNDNPNYGDNDEFNGIMEAINTSLVNMQAVLKFNESKNHQTTVGISESTEAINMKTENSEIGSTESLDRPTEMKFSAQKSYSLMLPEISKLKHRPLSSSSLCSTSSSSSSGSDNLNSKLNLNMSYLASVESLADHSEPELSGMTILERSCLEVFESERNYVEDLRQVITGYLSDWKELACLRVDELQTLFSNIEEIYEFSSKLLNLLIEAGMDPIKIAKCFINMKDYFDVYTKYCTSYPEAISLLTKLLQSTRTNNLLASTQKRLHHTLPLGSYLLKPVQRILKYHLLLDNLRKHCDVKEVTQAYEIMRQVARHIDQVKRRLEQQSRVKELSGILDGWLGPELTVLGELRLEGLLMEHNKPRMVFLFATMLIITKPKEDNRLIFKSLINQNNLMLNEHLPGEPTSFYVIPYDTPRNQIKLTAKNRDQKRVWTQHIKEAMLERFGNIPNRAKELVFKLGDEEDRSPGKNARKWTIHSTSMTPIYLERRNQYRRSELRKRSKQKRKTVTDLSTIEAEFEKEEPEQPTKPLTRNNSIDDSMVPRLLRLAAGVRSKNSVQSPTFSVSQEVLDTEENFENEQCACKNSVQSRERSKSVPKINFRTEEKKPMEKTATLKPLKANDVKESNNQAMVKRAAPLKKQRNTTKRDTFKFYMDISEFDQSDEATVLKITESTENVSKMKEQNQEVEVQSTTSQTELTESKAEKHLNVSTENKTYVNIKKDAQIVQELLKDSKEFERIYKKPQRKRSTETTVPKGLEKPNEKVVRERAPTPPSTSPPLLSNDSLDQHHEVDNEPIYESLLRNVHVPYKFSSPDFQRSKSLQCYTRREKKKPLPPRPESDYVTLKYTADGQLQQVGSDRISARSENSETSETSQQTLCAEPLETTEPSLNTTKSFEISNQELLSQSLIQINELQTTYHEVINEMTTALVASPIAAKSPNIVSQATPKPKNLVRRLFVIQNSSSGSSRMSSLENLSNAFLSRKNRRKSIDSLGTSNKPPERRASDVSEMCRLSILHRQGSQAVGERMASVDYADPRTLFNITPMAFNQLQRDSVVSLTSSSDSVQGNSQNNRLAKNSSTELSINFEYEDDVEASLEQNFRDSAIYSDDNNEKRPEFGKLSEKKDLKLAALNKRQSGVPPELPPKPPNLKTLMATSIPPGVVLCPQNMSKTASRSWVLQQIENFSK